MIKIWQECSNFQTTSQRLADQARTIIKKDRFSYLTSNINKQKQPNRNEPPTLKNGNTTQPNTQPNHPEQTLSQEQKSNLENLKRIMNSENTSLPSLETLNREQLGGDE